jgi:arsenate reductase
LAQKLNLRPKEFIRNGEAKFKELGLLSVIEDDEKILNAMVKYPKLMERPIIVNNDKACIGRPPEKILEII